MTTKLLNLTAHQINIQGFPPIEVSGFVARVHTHMHQDSSVNGIPVFVRSGETIVNLPQEQEGVMYIVTSYVREALPERKDLLSPAKFIRDERGVVIGCSALEGNK